VETLTAPLGWWALGAALVGSVWGVLAVAVPGWAAAGGGLLAATAVFCALSAAGSVRVGVRDGEVVAGRAHVPVACCGDVTPLDADAARRAGGPDADANAFLLLRPWVATAVRVDIADAHDPTPYWLVSTRHPERFAAATRTARGHEAR